MLPHPTIKVINSWVNVQNHQPNQVQFITKLWYKIPTPKNIGGVNLLFDGLQQLHPSRRKCFIHPSFSQFSNCNMKEKNTAVSSDSAQCTRASCLAWLHSLEHVEKLWGFYTSKSLSTAIWSSAVTYMNVPLTNRNVFRTTIVVEISFCKFC